MGLILTLNERLNLVLHMRV